MPDSTYDIKITTTGQPAGAEAVARSLDNVGKAAANAGKEAKNTGEATRSLGDDLSSLGQRNNATKDVLEGTEQALKGNTAAVFGTAKAVRNLIEVFTQSTPMGRFIQLATIAAGVMVLLKDKLFGTAKEAESTAEKFVHLTTAFEKIAVAKNESAKTQLTAIKEEAKAAGDELQRVLDLRDRLNKSGADAASAAINADPSLSSSEKVVRLQQLAARGVSQTRSIEDTKLAGELNTATTARDSSAAAASALADQISALEQAIKAGGVGSLNEQRAGAANELAGLQRKTGGSPEEAFARGNRMAELVKQIGALDQSIAAAKTPEAEAFRKEQLNLITSLRGAAQEAAKAASDAEENWRKLAMRVGGINRDGSIVPEPAIAIIRGNEDSTRRANDAKALRDAIAEDEAAQRTPSAAARARLAELTSTASSTGSTSTVSEPTRMVVNGVDITERVNASLRQQEAIGAAATRFARAVEAAAASANGTVEKLDAATQILEQQLRANRR